MNINLSNISLRMRFIAIILGIALLFWLPFEDTTETTAILYAISISTWLAVTRLERVANVSQSSLRAIIMAGILAGTAITPLTLFLMAFKTGLHAHAAPDYSNTQIMAIIRRTPIWIISGFFISIGLGFWLNGRQTRPESQNAAEC